jgi:hypothetical protein
MSGVTRAVDRVERVSIEVAERQTFLRIRHRTDQNPRLVSRNGADAGSGQARDRFAGVLQDEAPKSEGKDPL